MYLHIVPVRQNPKTRTFMGTMRLHCDLSISDPSLNRTGVPRISYPAILTYWGTSGSSGRSGNQLLLVAADLRPWDDFVSSRACDRPHVISIANLTIARDSNFSGPKTNFSPKECHQLAGRRWLSTVCVERLLGSQASVVGFGRWPPFSGPLLRPFLVIKVSDRQIQRDSWKRK